MTGYDSSRAERLAARAQLRDMLQAHPLYDIALEEVVKHMDLPPPRGYAAEDIAIELADVRQMMVYTWMLGAVWGHEYERAKILRILDDAMKAREQAK